MSLPKYLCDNTSFPLVNELDGVLLGNGQLGIFVWGKERTLNISFGCADLWDHRGAVTWPQELTYKNITNALKKGDEKAIENLMSAGKTADFSSTLLPLARMVLHLPKNSKLLYCRRELNDGLVAIVFKEASGRNRSLYLRLSVTMPFFVFNKTKDINYKLIPAWQISNALKSRNISAPEIIDNGFIQYLPEDEPFGMVIKQEHDRVCGGFFRGKVPPERFPDWKAVTADNQKWWSGFWTKTPEVKLDNPVIEHFYYQGLFQYASMSNPDGVTPPLQGPWLEDYRLPVFGADYHFNVNVQMCNMPALRCNCSEHLRPLFNMVLSWRKNMRRNAKCFVGIDDGYMIPHAVDDHGNRIGYFWPGIIDHACSAWIAQMMFEYCQYTGDVDYLETEVFEYMCGVMRVFEKMLEINDGEMELPVSVSPEYHEKNINAWGKNPAYQLAAIRRLAENLIEAAEQLGKSVSSSWREILDKLPEAPLAIRSFNGNTEIAVWENELLEKSHRHHSHLAGIFPFDTIDPLAPKWAETVNLTRRSWTRLGFGLWSGFSFPWAAMLYCRLGNGEMAETLLSIWLQCYTNECGNGTGDSRFSGISAIGENRHILQMDANMGAVSAIQDMLMFSQRGVLKIFFGIPVKWHRTHFDQMPAPRGFILGGEFRNGKTVRLSISATRGGFIQLELPDTEDFFTACNNMQFVKNKIFSRDFSVGEILIFEA